MLHDLPTIKVKLNGEYYNLKVAHSKELKKQGLSGVDMMGEKEGMIFPYNSDKPRTFQFKETLLPLMIYFVNSDGKIIQISSASAGQLEPISCNKPSRWVIEILDKDNYYAG